LGLFGLLVLAGSVVFLFRVVMKLRQPVEATATHTD
jgi:hypothetical protein